MRICPEIEMIPVMHGRELFAREIRRICAQQKFDCIAVDIPSIFQNHIVEAIDDLPLISALIAHHENNRHLRYYLPIDPCDAMIEGIRQARQRRIPFHCIGSPLLRDNPAQMPPMPDEYAIKKIGFDAYTALCLAAAEQTSLNYAEQTESKYTDEKLGFLRLQYTNILVITHVKRFAALKNFINPNKSYTDKKMSRLGMKPMEKDEPLEEGYICLQDLFKLADYARQRLEDPTDEMYDPDFKILTEDEYSEDFTVTKRYINPDHLYFALGELPFVAAKSQMERQDLFAQPRDPTDAIKDLFVETRDNYFDDKSQAVRLSPVRIQTALTFLRNLTVMDGRLIPGLLDIVEAAKGVGGNAYALRILKSAKYYPFLPIDIDDSGTVNVGIGKISFVTETFLGPKRKVYRAVNLFRDTEMHWRTIDIKPDPSMAQKKKYRYSWNPDSLCSHMPEDVRIESFNSHVRGKAVRIITEHLARSERFTSSVKDGIDIRETLRNWHTGDIYVKELPPANSKVDTVIIVFDEGDDERYPQRTTWYAEHENESTLSFYATGVFDDLIGPGIARCAYGGLSLIFPPRSIPNIFAFAKSMGIEGCTAQLVAGSLAFANEKNVAYAAPKPPSMYLRTLASRFKKHLVWIPLSTFSTETLNRLRYFHVLNGKEVRSWATRFIGNE